MIGNVKCSSYCVRQPSTLDDNKTKSLSFFLMRTNRSCSDELLFPAIERLGVCIVSSKNTVHSKDPAKCIDKTATLYADASIEIWNLKLKKGREEQYTIINKLWLRNTMARPHQTNRSTCHEAAMIGSNETKLPTSRAESSQAVSSRYLIHCHVNIKRGLPMG